MTRVLLFGAGSLGVPYSWVLCRAIGESNVTAVCRSNFDEASRNGFTIHSKLWGNDLKCKPRIAKTVADAVQQVTSDKQQQQQQPFFDFVVIAAKALPTRPSIAELIGPAVTPGTTGIVLIQNGIGIEAEYAARYPANPVLSAVAYFPATQVAPGVVEHKEVEMLHVGAYPATAPVEHKGAARAFVDLIKKGGASAELYDDVQRQRWGKLLVNASWNPVCALTRSRDRQFIDSKKGGDSGEDALGFIRDVMLEIAAVARAYGYADVDEKLVDFQINRARVRDLPGVQPSMLTDALESRSMEVDAIVGNAVKLAKEKGVPVPMLTTIYYLANGLSESFSRTKTQN